MLSDGHLQALILYKLFNRRCWGGKHTSFENLKKGIKASDLGKEGLKRVDRAGKEFIREGLILTKPTHYGLEVSLNSKMSNEIVVKIKSFFTL
jgi:hypothetical protein